MGVSLRRSPCATLPPQAPSHGRRPCLRLSQAHLKSTMKHPVRSTDAFLGRVVGHPAGFAFVNPIPGGTDSPPNPTLKVDVGNLNGALHGDIVMACVVGRSEARRAMSVT